MESIPLNPSLSGADTSRCPGLRQERPGGEAGLDQPELGLQDGNQATSPLSEPGQPLWLDGEQKSRLQYLKAESEGPEAES